MLVLSSLTVCIDGRAVLDRASASFAPGERVLLTGPSGSGKTTLLRVVAGLVQPGSGYVAWRDKIWSQGRKWVPPWKRGVGMVFQDLALWPHLTVRGHVDIVLKNKGFRRAALVRRREALVEALELSGLEGRRPHELSGGQQQRVALARALACEPEILLLDEAFNQMDSSLAARAWRCIDELWRDDGGVLICVAHQQALPRVTWHRRMCLEPGGRLMECGEEQTTVTPIGGIRR